jgi:hypothetical protein
VSFTALVCGMKKEECFCGKGGESRVTSAVERLFRGELCATIAPQLRFQRRMDGSGSFRP